VSAKAEPVLQEITPELLDKLPLQIGMPVRFEGVVTGMPKIVEGILLDAFLPQDATKVASPKRGSLTLTDGKGEQASYCCDFGWTHDYYLSHGQSYASSAIQYRKAYLLPTSPLKPVLRKWHAHLQNPYITVGSDPEIFGVDALGRVIPAWEWLGPKGIASQFWDGFQGEFCVPSGGCLDIQGEGIKNQLIGMESKLRAKFPSARLEPSSVVEVSKKQLADCSDEHVGLGCAPSLNAYGEPQLVVENPRQLPVRFAGGHMHFGFNNDGYKRPAGFIEGIMPSIVRTIDAIAGLAGVSLAAQWDDPRRRQFYGRAGEYRLPKHGLEYRVHSNFWLRDPRLYYLVWDLTRWALRVGWNGLGPLWQADPEEVRFAINETQPKLAREILRRNRDMLEVFVEGRYDVANVPYTLSVLLDGVEVIPTKTGNLLQAWEANQNWSMRWFRHAARVGQKVVRSAKVSASKPAQLAE